MIIPASGHRPIGSNTGFIFGSQAVGSILRAIYAAVLAREFGPELFGLFSFGLGWYAAFLAVANMQLESYMSQQVARSPAMAIQVMSQSMTLRTFSTVLAFVIAVATAIASGEDELLTIVLLICAVAMAGRSAAMWCNSAFISRESARHVFRVEVTFRVAEVLVGVSVLVAGFGLIAIVVVHALAWWCQSIYSFWLVRGHFPGIHFRPRLCEQLQLVRAVLPVAIASVGATWLMQGPLVLYKDRVSVPSDLGVVALVLQIFILVAGIPVALGRAALPALSRTVARTDNKEALFLSVVLRTAIAGTTGLIIAAYAAGAWIIPLIFGEAYRPAGAYLAWGMMLVLPFGVASIASQILVAHDRMLHVMSSAVIGAGAMTALVQMLVPAGGSIAVYFLCVIAGMLVWATTALVLLSRCVKIKWRQWLAKPMLASVLSLVTFHLLAGAIGPVTGLFGALAVLVAGQWVFSIVDRQERDSLSRCVRARFGDGP